MPANGHSIGMTRRLLAVALGAALVVGASASPAVAADRLSIDVLSNRADMISGGDALVAVDLPAGTDASQVDVTNNGEDVTASFALRPDGRFEGLVTGLKLGDNAVRASAPGVASDSVTIVNHRNGGPLLSGPQLQPWVCQPTAVDTQCNQPPTYSYVYYSTGGQIGTYDPANPPSDVANTTTDNGVTVPWIVRIETGYQDRDQYQIAALWQPGKPWAPWAPQPQWDHKVIVIHGALCGVEHQTGASPDITTQWIGAIGQGYIGMSTALDNAGHNCNIAMQAESLIMAKERIVEQYGGIRFAIGYGCSGGSLVEQQVANAYPGIYQGLLATCSFPDSWSVATQILDNHLTLGYFTNPTKWGTGVAWSPTQMADVQGHVSIGNSEVTEALFPAAVPTTACAGVTAQQRYDPNTNPGGVRCDIQDAAINIFGPRPPADWTPNEQKLGHGFAAAPVDNVGVQYGLSALQQGKILPSQFIDLNKQIGGLDVDMQPTPTRMAAREPVLANAYRSGAINEANNLDQTAIIDCRGPDVSEGHDAYRAFALRARLDREHGNHTNQLIWEGPLAYPGTADEYCVYNSFVAMDRWLTAVEKDTGPTALAQKIATDKPSDLSDRCYDGDGHQLLSTLCPDAAMTILGTPRTVAGDVITTDTNKCVLRPLNRNDDYGPIPFTDDQWTQLEAIFPKGICDYSKPGVGQQGTLPWQTYQADPAGDDVITGGKPLGPASDRSGTGWTSPAFSDWLSSEGSDHRYRAATPASASHVGSN